MHKLATTASVVAMCWLCVGLAAAQERLTVWLTFDNARIGLGIACDGEVRVSGGGKVTLREWLHDKTDSVEGVKFRLTTEHDAQSAETARLGITRRATLPKGLLIHVDAPASATLSAATRLGDFAVPLDQLRKQRTALVLDGKARLQLIPNVTALTGDQAEEEFPSVAVMLDGRVAVAYVAWDGKADKVLVRVGDETREVTERPGDYHDPRCAVDGGGKLWVVWAANDGEQWDLWARSDGKPVKLTTNPRNDLWPRLARDTRGNLWVAWQTVADDLHYEVMLARLGPDGLATPVNVSEHAADDWEPAICATADGRIVVAWDTYRNGSFDVYLREFSAEGKPIGAPRPVAASAAREAHVTVAADSKSRVWLAWDVGSEDWGKHPPKGEGSLHASRSTDLACYADGKLQRVGASFMQSLPPPLSKCIEYPQIAIDGRDRVWVLFRFLNEARVIYKPNANAIGQHWSMWHLFAAQYDGTAWSAPILLAQSNGRQDMRVDVARDKTGELLVAYAGDGRTREVPHRSVDHDVFLASLAGFGVPMQPLRFANAGDLGRVTPAKPDPELLPLPREWSVGGQSYRLVIGDTHRHTDISQCMNGGDGSLQDAYRYALDACGLDWLAISDHDNNVIKPGPRDDYNWWRSQKFCDLYSIPGRFVAIYGYERGRLYERGGGHKNVLYARRGLPLHQQNAPAELFAALADSGAIVIPHQLADGTSRTDWEKWNPDYERVGEIFQGRGSYEFEGCPRAVKIFTPGFSMWDALAKGLRIGIIASSDHGLTHQARAGVYIANTSAGFTRRDVLDALHARRAYGATTACAMQVKIGNRILGEEITVAVPPKIEARIIAPAPIKRAEVVRDGRFVHTSEPNAPQASFEFADMELKPGQSAWYYVRAQIGANDLAWSSPIWVTRAP